MFVTRVSYSCLQNLLRKFTPSHRRLQLAIETCGLASLFSYVACKDSYVAYKNLRGAQPAEAQTGSDAVARNGPGAE